MLGNIPEENIKRGDLLGGLTWGTVECYWVWTPVEQQHRGGKAVESCWTITESPEIVCDTSTLHFSINKYTKLDFNRPIFMVNVIFYRGCTDGWGDMQLPLQVKIKWLNGPFYSRRQQKYACAFWQWKWHLAPDELASFKHRFTTVKYWATCVLTWKFNCFGCMRDVWRLKPLQSSTSSCTPPYFRCQTACAHFRTSS